MPPDVIFLPVPDGRKCAHTIIFVTGNPGLIGYYRRFLTSLHQNVNAAGSGRGVAVYGRSLGGFEVNSTAEKPRLHALNDEIELVWQIIDQAVQNASDHNAEKTQISLCGHSLGTYIILCVLERYYSDWHERDISYRIESAVLLFPAVADLAKSPSGKRVRLLLAIPGLPVVVGTLAWALANMIPSSLLKSIVGSSSTYREANIKNERDEAAEATVAFLKSRLGVRQTLSLAAEEIRHIKSDAFSEFVWGSDGVPVTERTTEATDWRVKLFFYFGKNDHWVAEQTRNDLISSRAYQTTQNLADRVEWRKDSRPWMKTDKLGTDHSFCIGSSDAIAEKVAEFMRAAL